MAGFFYESCRREWIISGDISIFLAGPGDTRPGKGDGILQAQTASRMQTGLKFA